MSMIWLPGTITTQPERMPLQNQEGQRISPLPLFRFGPKLLLVLDSEQSLATGITGVSRSARAEAKDGIFHRAICFGAGGV